ncbi:MAG: hypothetical protein ACHQ4G_01790 [Opitutales bacterium]
MKSFVPGRPYWWQWPTILSLDAPAVALAWQWMLARIAGNPLVWYHYQLLGAAAWLVYAADRWIEGWWIAPSEMQTQRHLFYQRYRWPTFGVWLAVALFSFGNAVVQLNDREFRTGIILVLPVLVYLFSHQLIHRHHPWRAPKEICVALLFAAGVACFTLARMPAAANRLAVPLALFGLLCFANCALISIWENEVDLRHGQTSLALQYPGGRKFVQALPWMIALLAAGFAGREAGAVRTAALCAVGSGLGLGAVDFLHRRCGRLLARVLADFALLTPVVPWLLQVGFRL